MTIKLRWIRRTPFQPPGTCTMASLPGARAASSAAPGRWSRAPINFKRRAVRHGRACGRAPAHRSRQRRPTARLLQRLPPSCRGGCDGTARQCEHLSLSLSRLELWPRWLAERRARVRGRLRLRSRAKRPCPAEGRDLGAVRLRQPRSKRSAARGISWADWPSGSRRSTSVPCTSSSAESTPSTATGRSLSTTISMAATTFLICTRA